MTPREAEGRGGSGGSGRHWFIAKWRLFVKKTISVNCNSKLAVSLKDYIVNRNPGILSLSPVLNGSMCCRLWLRPPSDARPCPLKLSCLSE
jgi:hypothetical protein